MPPMADQRVAAADGDVVSTDEVLAESVERVRSSRQLIEHIDVRLARSNELLGEDGTIDLRGT